MSTDTQPTPSTPTTGATTSKVARIAAEVFGPVPAGTDPVRRRMQRTRSAVAYLGVVSTLVQVVVWMTIAVITAHIDSPWWLWTAVPAGVAVGAITAADHWRGWWTSTQEETA